VPPGLGFSCRYRFMSVESRGRRGRREYEPGAERSTRTSATPGRPLVAVRFARGVCGASSRDRRPSVPLPRDAYGEIARGTLPRGPPIRTLRFAGHSSSRTEPDHICLINSPALGVGTRSPGVLRLSLSDQRAVAVMVGGPGARGPGRQWKREREGPRTARRPAARRARRSAREAGSPSRGGRDRATLLSWAALPRW
jgi:hypothetical protein